MKFPLFDQLVHSDWSIGPKKRWMAEARHQEGRWHVEAPQLVGPSSAFLDAAFGVGRTGRVLLGFDFPIGMPHAYGVQTGFGSFPQALAEFGAGNWADVFDVAREAHEIAITRPFYPQTARKGVTRQTLVDSLRVESFASLHRICELRTARRQAASCLFWTLGGNQVGKAALAGWREIVRPAMVRGARLWPFDGDLASLATRPGVVLAETYPAEAYHVIGAPFRSNESKRRNEDRRRKAAPIHLWAERRKVFFSADARRLIDGGFGPLQSGEDAFDALLGLLKMIEVADGHLPEASEHHPKVASWEGWILGR